MDNMNIETQGQFVKHVQYALWVLMKKYMSMMVAFQLVQTVEGNVVVLKTT